MLNLRAHRSALGISQSKLARLSGVSRFKICTFELGADSLTLESEIERLRSISARISVVDFSQISEFAAGYPQSSAQVEQCNDADDDGKGRSA
jgi:transcriptional regulator with XRE-family HTH domain